MRGCCHIRIKKAAQIRTLYIDHTQGCTAPNKMGAVPATKKRILFENTVRIRTTCSRFLTHRSYFAAFATALDGDARPMFYEIPQAD